MEKNLLNISNNNTKRNSLTTGNNFGSMNCSNSSSPSPSSHEDQTLKDCEAYVSKHNIKDLLKDCIVQLCLRKPEHPITFLKQHFEKLEKVIVVYAFNVLLFKLSFCSKKNSHTTKNLIFFG